jgi:hypothetical protein
MSRPKIRTQGKKLDELAVAIGHICIYWGRLENDLNEFIECLTPLDEGDVSRSITAGMDIRTKVQTIKALSYLRKPSKEWFENMMLYLDYIDNNLRPRRNRIIHDGWYTPSGRLVRDTRHIKFERPQSFQLLLKTQTIVPIKLFEVRQLAAELDDLIIISFAFWYDYVGRNKPRALPNRLFRRFLRRAKPDARPKYARSARHIPPEPSQG